MRMIAQGSARHRDSGLASRRAMESNRSKNHAPSSGTIVASSSDTSRSYCPAGGALGGPARRRFPGCPSGIPGRGALGSPNERSCSSISRLKSFHNMRRSPSRFRTRRAISWSSSFAPTAHPPRPPSSRSFDNEPSAQTLHTRRTPPTREHPFVISTNGTPRNRARFGAT